MLLRYVIVNTLISGNLPSVIGQQIGNIKEERRREVDTEGDFIISGSSRDNKDEIIVDNEDTTLFVLSEPDVVGLLPKWLDKVEDTSSNIPVCPTGVRHCKDGYDQ